MLVRHVIQTHKNVPWRRMINWELRQNGINFIKYVCSSPSFDTIPQPGVWLRANLSRSRLRERARHTKTPLKSHKRDEITALHRLVCCRLCRFPGHRRRNNYRQPNHVCRLKRETSTSFPMLLSNFHWFACLHEYSKKMLQSGAVVNKLHWRFRYVELYAVHQTSLASCLTFRALELQARLMRQWRWWTPCEAH